MKLTFRLIMLLILMVMTLFPSITHAQDRGYIEPIFKYSTSLTLDGYSYYYDIERNVQPTIRALGLNLFVPVTNGHAIKIGVLYSYTDIRMTTPGGWFRDIADINRSIEVNVGIRFYHSWIR